MDASKKENIDDYYKKWAPKLSEDEAEQIRILFNEIVKYIKSLTLDFEKYKINGVSHFYAIFAFAKRCIEVGAKSEEISTKLEEFFNNLRNSGDFFGDVKEYRESMQASTRSKSQRIKRIHALIHFCGLPE